MSYVVLLGSSLAGDAIGGILTQKQNFVNQIAAIPNLKLDYVVLNAGVLRYPNVSHTYVVD